VHIELTQLVKAPREDVFRTFTDFEAWPSFSRLFARVAIMERTGQTVRLDTDVKVLGRTLRRIERHVLTPPGLIQVTGETEGATNTTEWRFETAPEGTLVTAVLDIGSAGITRLLGPFANRQAKSMLHDWMQAFAKYVETDTSA
jgi:ribosome-associated toxin RatA of RatAB toxin-antitoxin module